MTDQKNKVTQARLILGWGAPMRSKANDNWNSSGDQEHKKMEEKFHSRRFCPAFFKIDIQKAISEIREYLNCKKYLRQTLVAILEQYHSK